MKIAFIANTDFGLYRFRLGLMKALLERGDKVVAIAPGREFLGKIAQFGITTYSITLDRKGLNPFKDFITFVQIYRLLKKEKPSIVHTFTIKPNIYGSLATRLAGVPRLVNSVTGLGYVFSSSNRWLQKIVINLYRIAFRSSHRVIFQNQEDLELFVKLRILNRAKSCLIRGSGVNLNEFSINNVNEEELNKLKTSLNLIENSTIDNKTQVVIISFIGRLLWQKGIREFIQAAEKLKNKYPHTMFLVVGEPDVGNPDTVSVSYLQLWDNRGTIKYLGWQSNIREIMALSDVIAFPSYYGEGIPRVLLEALAMGKPIVTTNHAGCRETVEPGLNGFLVPVRNVDLLVEALEKLILDKDLRMRFGKYSRIKAQREFSEGNIIWQTLQIYDSLTKINR